MIQLSPSFFARVWRANASEPDAASDKQKLPSYMCHGQGKRKLTRQRLATNFRCGELW